MKKFLKSALLCIACATFALSFAGCDDGDPEPWYDDFSTTIWEPVDEESRSDLVKLKFAPTDEQWCSIGAVAAASSYYKYETVGGNIVLKVYTWTDPDDKENSLIGPFYKLVVDGTVVKQGVKATMYTMPESASADSSVMNGTFDAWDSETIPYVCTYQDYWLDPDYEDSNEFD